MKMTSDVRGISILEVLVAIAIFLMVSAGTMEIFMWGFRGRDIVWEQLSTQNEGRKIVQDFVNQLRRAGQSAVGGYAIESADNQQIVFYSNIDMEAWRERLRYFLVGTTLKVGITRATGTPVSYNLEDEVVTEIVHDVANTTTPLFYYYDENYTGVTNTTMSAPIDTTEVRLVGIKLLLEEKPNVAPAPFAIETKVSIRNLKTN
ncbi:MAG: hypothetical protein A2538_02310 [Candidatus Magasanikbacteria bacterium RIFOXYD2_FULL_41_14]|uniref:Prepilin-type N-terminal cleavage/methylation domain-containing protein n=1 Tax=Candidatus Magasanikbacteria bacterium RIFOXYD2_FULL_41_14 TaxID=1798709 RepID=A0A1F6PBZ7_9BACT|nr:MAG: hypothetical protein A2538_02310 [Candidatus Magasanikbacteria bacterium RIFOXYD2_FULL_41_14]